MSDLAARLKTVIEERPDKWRRVEDFPDYWVSRDGYVVGPRRKLRPTVIRNGYARVCLHAAGRPRRQALVHVLVAELFLGPKPVGDYQVNHIDGDRLHNAVANLEYLTGSENMLHAFQVLGRIPTRGSRIGTSRLTESIVRDIRAKYDAGAITPKQAAAIHGVTVDTIHKITSRRSWKYPAAEPGNLEELA